VAKGSPGSGRVTTLRQVRQSETAEASTPPATLSAHQAKPLSSADLPQALKDILGRPQ